LRPKGRPLLTVQLVSTPVRDGDGEVTGYRTVLWDVSALKEMEQRLRFLADAGEKLGHSLDVRSTADAAAQLAVPFLADLAFLDVLDEEGNLQRASIAFADPARDVALRGRIQALAGGRGGSLQWEVMDSGEPLLFADLQPSNQVEPDPVVSAARIKSMMIVPLPARGRTFGALSLAAIHSDRRYAPADLLLAQNLGQRAAVALENARLHEEAQRAIRAREGLLAAVSHDLRTPLSTIMTKAATLLRLPGSGPDSPVHKAGAVIVRAGDRMGRLIKDLLDIASIEAGHLAIERGPQPITALVAEAIETLEAKAADKQVRLAADLPAGDPACVLCDRERILEVLSNLLDNAVKFSPNGAEVRVGAQRAGVEVRFFVSDEGAGIQPEHVRHLFHRFWQAEKTARQGTGLGLSIAKGIVEAHGGRIWVETSAGRGSTFLFTLPLAGEASLTGEAPLAARPTAPVAPAPPAAPGAPPSPPAPDEGRPRPTVLVVDDDPDARDALGETLEDEGYRVAKATHGGEALAYLRSAPEPVLAVLLDLNMPVMDGWTFLAERNGDPALCTVNVIVVSGTRDVEEKVARAGARYVEKPVRTKKLLAVLEQREAR
jgi:signal transduction histidine kinase